MLYLYPSDHPIFERGTLPRRLECSEEEREARFAELEIIRSLVLRTAGGCENTADLILRHFDEDLSCQDVAQAMGGVNRSTAWHRLNDWKETIRWEFIADLAHPCFTAGAGFTIDLERGELLPVGTAAGFVVSVAGKSRFFSLVPNREQIVTYLRSHARTLRAHQPPKFYLGGWIHHGYHLDLNILWTNLQEAIEFALVQGQQCVFDLRRGTEIFVDGGQRRAA